mgnify:CR=1 FL=1
MIDMPEERNLDSIYIRVQLDGQWVSRCLTDCPWPVVETWLRDASKRVLEPLTYVISTVEHLHKRLRSLGDQLDIQGGPPS